MVRGTTVEQNCGSETYAIGLLGHGELLITFLPHQCHVVRLTDEHLSRICEQVQQITGRTIGAATMTRIPTAVPVEIIDDDEEEDEPTIYDDEIVDLEEVVDDE